MLPDCRWLAPVVFIDTLHRVHEGRLFRWGYDPAQAPSVLEYGRTSPDGLAATGFDPKDVQAAARCRNSPFYQMLQTGDSLLRRRLSAATKDEFAWLSDLYAEGVPTTSLSSAASPRTVSSAKWTVFTRHGQRRRRVDSAMARSPRLNAWCPYLALAIKSVALVRMTGTLMETYLGRDAGQRVLGGRILRGVADRIDAVVWFSDLRGFTRITDTAPEQAIPLLNDYSDVIVSAIHEHGGDVLKLIGDGTLAIFTAADRAQACTAALSAAIATREGIVALNKRRQADGEPVTDMYLGLHVGDVFYGNVGGRERLDFTVIGPAVNEASRIAAMCRSVDQPVLMSSAFANVGVANQRLVSVGRYALRGVAHPQELFTFEPGP